MSFGILIFKESNTDQLLSSKMQTIISNPEIVKIFAPLTDNPNLTNQMFGETPIHKAAQEGHT